MNCTVTMWFPLYRCFSSVTPAGKVAAAGGAPEDPPPGSSTCLDKAAENLKDLYEAEEKTSDPIHESFAKLVDGGLRRRPGEEATKRLLQSHPRPINVPNLQVPRTNPEVYEAMKKGATIIDASIQRAQGMLARSLSTTLEMVNVVGTNSTSPLEAHLEQISDIVRGLTAAFMQLCQSRKDVIRSDTGEPLSRLCGWSTKVGTTMLFDGDVAKSLKEKEAGRLRLRRRGGGGRHRSTFRRLVVC